METKGSKEQKMEGKKRNSTGPVFLSADRCFSHAELLNWRKPAITSGEPSPKRRSQHKIIEA